MKKTNKLSALANDGSAVKSKSFVHNATDTFHELILIFATVITLGGTAFMIVEPNRGWLESLWWAIVTAFTVGYGDEVPVTVAGRVVGTILMSFTVFVIIPLITARIVSKMVVNDDTFTDTEQKELIRTAKRMNTFLDSQDVTKQKPNLSTAKLKKVKVYNI